MSGRRATAAVALGAAVLAGAAAGGALVARASAGPVRIAPAASAFAVEVREPGRAPARLVRARLDRPVTQATRLALPPGGALLRADAAAAVATTGPDAVGGVATLTRVRLLGGEVTADAVTVAVTHPAPASADTVAAGGPPAVSGLAVLGVPVTATPGARIPVGDWAVLEIGTAAATPVASASAFGLRLRLVATHRGLPVGTVITVGRVTATGTPAPVRVTATRSAGRSVHVGAVAARLTPGRRSFPLARRTPVTDTFGAGRAGVAWHHGIDLFGPRGTPVLAVADGTLFDVGWNPLGGHRLWLRDAAGTTYYYAHLDAYATGIRTGSHVHAGQPLGILGSTGDAERTPPHLHFEIHPAALAAVGYDSAIDPSPALRAWAGGRDLSVAAAPALPSPHAVTPRPAAFLLEVDPA